MQAGNTWWPCGTHSQEMGMSQEEAMILSCSNWVFFSCPSASLFAFPFKRPIFVLPSPFPRVILVLTTCVFYSYLCFVFPSALFCHSQQECCSELGDYPRLSAADGCRWGCAGLMLPALQAQALYCVCLNVLIVTLYSTHLPCRTSLSGTFSHPSSLCPLFLRPRVSDGKMSGGGRWGNRTVTVALIDREVAQHRC